MKVALTSAPDKISSVTLAELFGKWPGQSVATWRSVRCPSIVVRTRSRSVSNACLSASMSPLRIASTAAGASDCRSWEPMLHPVIQIMAARTVSSYQQLGSIFGRKRLGALDAFGPLRIAELRRRRGAAVDGVADRHEELFLSRWRAHAEQACRLVRHVLERVGRIGGGVLGGAGGRPLGPAP